MMIRVVIQMRYIEYTGGYNMSGRLYLCATPIGNLSDITLRCLDTLKEVDIIAAEDTRQTIKLLNHYEIKKPLFSYHEHNKYEKGIELISRMQNGDKVALVSDAGMPAISDPGEDLVRLCVEHNIPVIPIPGASASLCALIVSGLPTKNFYFEGFLPSAKKDKKLRLEKLSLQTGTIIIYESPHRLKDTLKELREYFGNRKISLSRELTKKFEETVRGSVDYIISHFEKREIKGEFVLIIDGINEKDLIDIEQKKWDNISISEHLDGYISQGMSKKEAIAAVAKDRNLPKKEIYAFSIKMQNEKKEG